MPTYNGARTLPLMIARLRAQDYELIEWIIVDDASSDGTGDLAARLISESPQPTTLIRHATNVGLSKSLNEGLARASGDYVLVLHQDIELVGNDWIRRAVEHLQQDSSIAVVTAYYGLPASGELNLAMRSFGYIRQQFHSPRSSGVELVTFAEFKCDLFRREVVASQGNFPDQFRIAGEDIVLSYRLRRAGYRIMKCYDLVAVQRFTGPAETVRGNLYKDYRFGMAITGTLRTYGTYAFRELDTSRYARSRSLHRASQPTFILGLAIVIVAGAILGLVGLILLAGLLVAGRWTYYVVRLAPEFRTAGEGLRRPVVELLAAAGLGLASDLAYSLGVLLGFVRGLFGAPL